MRRWSVVLGMSVGTMSVMPLARAAEAPRPSPPAVVLDEGEIQKLIGQLGHEDFQTRDRATQRLRVIGEPALGALKQAAQSPDVETRTRAASLARRIEFGSLPGGPVDETNGKLVVRGLQLTNNGRNKTLSVHDGVRDIKISEAPGSVEMTVSAMEEGRVATATYRAASRAELRAEEPEAFKLYDRWTQGFREDRIELRGGFPGAVQVPAIQAAEPADGAEAIRQLANRVDKQMSDAKLDVRTRKEVFTLLDQLRDLQAGEALDPPENQDQRMKSLFTRSDELRERLAQLKLPDPGDALPPPSKSRLGIGYNPVRGLEGNTERVVVTQVVTGSRAEKLGLRAGDALRRIGEKPITDSKDVRPALMEARSPLVVEVEREGERLTLTEKLEDRG